MSSRFRSASLKLFAGAIALSALAGCSRFESERASLRHDEVSIQADVVMVDP